MLAENLYFLNWEISQNKQNPDKQFFVLLIPNKATILHDVLYQYRTFKKRN